MADTPWLTIVGIGEDGAAGLSDAAKAAIARAAIVTGAARHLALMPDLSRDGKTEVRTWPVPFADGIAQLLADRGRAVVLLASGDPFWFGAGTAVTRHLAQDEWIAHPGRSTFAIAAARLGWAIETTACLGLHAAPFARLRPHVAPGARALVLVRDGAAAHALSGYLCELGFGGSRLHILEALGGPRETIRETTAATLAFDDIAHPVAVGITFAGAGDGDGADADADAGGGGAAAMPRSSGLDDRWFAHDGQITKRPIRALTLSALGPIAGERLWDIGAGSGSIGIEWLLADASTEAIAFEADPQRAARARANAAALGVDRLVVIEGRAPSVLDGHALPDAVFVGGGLSGALLAQLWGMLAAGTRLVANAVTLESEALLAEWHRAKGGTLLRIELAEAVALGTRRGWQARYPVVQWSVTL